jgi:general secretion pathway protein D
MKNNTRTLLARSTALYVACAIAASGPGFAQAQRAKPSREPVTLNFVNADIEAVARTMAAITGRNIVVDPRVKGTMTLSTERPVAPSVAYNQFLTALRLSGFTMVESQGLLKLVPEADAKLQTGAVYAGPAPAAGAQMVTQIFRLSYEPAGNLVPILRPLISPNNTINVNTGNNSLVITDYADNLQRIGRIIAALDVTNATDVDVIPLMNVLAADVAPVVQRLIDASGAAAAAGAAPGAAPQAVVGDSSFRTTIIPEARSNSLLVRAANPARLSLVRSLVQKLDQPTGQSMAGNIWVVYLKNADATRLAVTLRAALAAMAPSGAAASVGGGQAASVPSASAAAAAAQGTGAASPQATAPTQPVAQVSTGGQIQADPATNALIITAAEPQYRQIRAVIDLLDSRRAQVYVESLIAEVSTDRVGQFGIQWQTNLNNSNSGTVGVIGTNFTAPPANIISLATQPGGSTSPTVPSPGLNFGTISHIAGRWVLTSIANFLQTTGDGNVLATPNLLTLDNEEAKIVVGQNVPFITGQFTNTGAAAGSVNPFQTIERRDVGLTLRVRPQISENGTIKMQIFQEVSSIDQTSVNSATGLITNKRSLESSILVDDGNIVVLGGLLQDDYSASQGKVPGLGDIPLLGDLFKTQNRERKKTNLMVFLRPVVIRDAAQSNALSLDRYELMRGMQMQAQPQPSLVTPVNESAVMPPPVMPATAPALPPAPVPGPTAPSALPPTSSTATIESRPVVQQSIVPPPLGR